MQIQIIFFFLGATLLQKRKKQTKIKKEETIDTACLFVPLYRLVGHFWKHLTLYWSAASEHYRTAGEKQLKTRTSSKLEGIISKSPAEINDLDIR